MSDRSRTCTWKAAPAQPSFLEHRLAAGHADMANALRFLAMDAVEKAQSGHPGMPMGMADAATVLFTRFMKFDATRPHWPDRDRFVLSAGHGSMLLYALLHLTGHPGMTIDELQRFRQMGSLTPGHPEFGHTVGVETTTGPLGQGIATAVGMAIAERMLNEKYGDRVCNHYTYVLAGDGCLMEGISHEAISLAGHLGLGKLIVLWDDNRISIDGPTHLSVSDDQLARFEASGWEVIRVNGHDPEAIAAALTLARGNVDYPSLIACETTIGYGAPNKQGKSSTHGEPLGATEIAATRENLGWPHAPFVVPDAVAAAWRETGTRHRDSYEAWRAACAEYPDDPADAMGDPIGAECLSSIHRQIAAAKQGFLKDGGKLATRQSSQKVLERLVPVLPALVGGSADLSGSNGTRTSRHRAIQRDNYEGNYIHYGVREHAMAAAMNGIALHGGYVPYGGTFLVFADYCRPAIRLSALMEQRVIYVLTHDSIALGEDGPTHQPVEHLASLRAIPNLNVMRPADALECAECWELALAARSTPSILALTRQGLPLLRTQDNGTNRSTRGAYVLREPAGGRDLTLLATGSEVSLAVDAANLLDKEGIRAAVVSMPCWELFASQPEDYRAAVLGTAPRIGIEAAIKLGWEQWLDRTDRFIGMTGYGASAPGPALMAHFGLTTERIIAAAHELIAAPAIAAARKGGTA